MRRILKIAALVLATLVPPHALAANTWGTDFSDLWWKPSESGWGANVAHQGEIIFMTVFVYGADNRVRWFVAPAMASQGGVNSMTFVGTLHETAGPYLGDTTFDPQAVGIRTVGNATLQFGAVEAGVLTYSVDGAQVSKAIERQTFRSNNLAGSYFGSEVGTVAGCGTGSAGFENHTALVVSQSGNAVSILTTLSDTLSCTYAGIHAQSGRMGRIQGTMTCTNGSQGSFVAAEVEAGHLGFLSRYTVDYGSGCVETGRMGGMRR